MGNVPGKEERKRSNSQSTANFTESLRSSYRRGTNPISSSSLSTLKKSKRQKEKDAQREEHYMNLIVRLNENVDGGYLAPYGTYKSNLDYNSEIVRNLIINRKLSPFYTPLQDFSDDWSDNELIIISNQLPLHSIDDPYSEFEEEVDDADDHKIHKSSNFLKKQEQKQKLKDMVLRIKALQKNEEQNYQDLKMNIKMNELTNLKKEDLNNLPSNDFQLHLYKTATECPICFLYYPKYLNISRCCLQPICSECFVQIKRLDPHPPHDDNNSETNEKEVNPESLISEPAYCPFCAMPDFGVTFNPPNFRTGIGGIDPGKFKSTSHKRYNSLVHGEDLSKLSVLNEDGDSSAIPSSAISNSPLESNEFLISSENAPLRRKSSLAANAPGVVTIDQIRPDWETTLINAKAKLARKSATATAIHASNLLLGNSNNISNDSNQRRRFGQRRNNSANSVEEKMIEEALKLSLLEEEERKLVERNKKLKK